MSPTDIRPRCLAAGVSLADLARDTGYGQSTLRRWAAGHTRPSGIAMERVERALSMPRPHPSPGPEAYVPVPHDPAGAGCDCSACLIGRP